MIRSIPEWIELVSLSCLIGTLTGGIWIFPPSGDPQENENTMGRAWQLFGACIIAMILTSVVCFFLRASEMSGQPFPEVWGMLPTVLFRTHFGHIWLVKVSALLALGIVFTAGMRNRTKRAYLFLPLILCIVISMTESASGHASDAGDFSLPEFWDWLHLIAASVWGGGLFALSTSVLPALEKRGWNQEEAWVTAGIARRFSAMAVAAVGLIAVTAFCNSVLYVGSFAALVKTPYGRTATLKLLLFVAVIGLGVFNRYVSVHLLQSKAGLIPGRRGMRRIIWNRFGEGPHGKTVSELLRNFSRAVKIEAVLILAILLGAALLHHQIPARHLARMRNYPGGTHMRLNGIDQSP
jgi:putative copper resistance protein D